MGRFFLFCIFLEMSQDQTEIINIFCHKLPFELSNQLFNEYQVRLKNIEYLLNKDDTFKELRKDIEVIKVLLAMTIFYKRVISNFDAARKFVRKVSAYTSADNFSKGQIQSTVVQLGYYELTIDEVYKIDRIIRSYETINRRYHIPDTMHQYEETQDLLKRIQQYKLSWMILDRRQKQ